MSGWPAGYVSTVTNGLCDFCKMLRRIRLYAEGWTCKECRKAAPLPATQGDK